MTSQYSSKLYIALIIIGGLAAGYLYYSQIAQPAEPTVPPAPITAHDDLKSFQDLKIDFSIFTSPLYKNLNIFGESPVNPGVTGKKDLFAPF